MPSSGLFIRHAKNVQINGLMLNSESPDARIPVIAVDVEGLQIQTISKINTTASVFFKGIAVKNISIDKPLGWDKEVVQ